VTGDCATLPCCVGRGVITERAQETLHSSGIAKYQEIGRRRVLRDRLQEAWPIFSAIRQ
jgi:hypothetical protein